MSDQSRPEDDAAAPRESEAPGDAEVAQEATGEPEPESDGDGEQDSDTDPGAEDGAGADERRPGARGVDPTRLLVVLLLVLLGFTLTVQVRHVADDPTVAALGQEDLVRILANLDAHEERLREELAELRETHRRLTTAGESQQEAVAEAERRADELGVLAGTLPVTGPGVTVQLHGGGSVTAARLLDAVQELRSAGAEAIQIGGAGTDPVRVVTSTYFLDADEGLIVDGELLRAPFTVTAVGDPPTLAPALRIPGGVVESVERDGGTVIVEEVPGGVDVSAVVSPEPLEHARPGS